MSPNNLQAIGGSTRRRWDTLRFDMTRMNGYSGHECGIGPLPVVGFATVVSLV